MVHLYQNYEDAFIEISSKLFQTYNFHGAIRIFLYIPSVYCTLRAYFYYASFFLKILNLIPLFVYPSLMLPNPPLLYVSLSTTRPLPHSLHQRHSPNSFSSLTLSRAPPFSSLTAPPPLLQLSVLSNFLPTTTFFSTYYHRQFHNPLSSLSIDGANIPEMSII